MLSDLLVLSAVLVSTVQRWVEDSLCRDQANRSLDPMDRHRTIRVSSLCPFMRRGLLTQGSKNVRLQMGRCPVRHVFAESLAVLKEKQDSFRFVSFHGLVRHWLRSAVLCSTR